MTEELRVLVVDDHPSVRAGVVKALHADGYISTAEAASVAEAMASIASHPPGALIIDITMKDGNGLDVVTWLRSLNSEIAITVLSFNDSDDVVLASMRAGASAFVSKSSDLRELISVFKRTLQAPQGFTSLELSRAIISQKDSFNLSPREMQILMQLDSALTNQQLAASLFISEATLKTHLSAIYRKLEVGTRIQAIHVAKKAGIISTTR
jgi:DNA-binding NarL/FixJ family response regulator